MVEDRRARLCYGRGAMEPSTKKAIILTSVGCAGVIVLFCLASAAGLYFAKDYFLGAPGAAREYLSDLHEGRTEAAFERMAVGYRQTHDLAAFEHATRALPALARHEGVSFGSISVVNRYATVLGVLTVNGGTSEVPVRLELHSDGHEWQVAAGEVDGVRLR